MRKTNGEISYFNLTLVVVISLTIVGLVYLATNENLSTKSIVVSETRLVNVPGNAEIYFIEKQDSHIRLLYEKYGRIIYKVGKGSTFEEALRDGKEALINWLAESTVYIKSYKTKGDRAVTLNLIFEMFDQAGIHEIARWKYNNTYYSLVYFDSIALYQRIKEHISFATNIYADIDIHKPDTKKIMEAVELMLDDLYKNGFVIANNCPDYVK